MLADDLKVREYLKAKLKKASVSKIMIERPAKNANITIYSARPGVVFGKKGEEINSLKTELSRRLGVPVELRVKETQATSVDAQLIAESITEQLERRVMFRRAMKRAVQAAMQQGAQGIKILSSGRMNGIEIARNEWYRDGRMPLHTLKADVEYGFSQAKTNYGLIGVKCWVYHGDRLEPSPTKADVAPARAPTRSLFVERNAVPPGVVVLPVGQREAVQVEPAPEPVVSQRSTKPDADEARRIVEAIPRWAQEQLVGAPQTVTLSIGGEIEPEQLLDFVAHARPRPIKIVADLLEFVSGKSYAAIGVFPSGAIRTIGQIEIDRQGKGRIRPFSYLSLIDPDAQCSDPQSVREVQAKLDLVVLEVV